MKINFPLIMAAIVIGSMAVAQEVEDNDGDGMYSLEEIQAAYPDVNEDGFAIADTSGDGLLDMNELSAAQDAGLIPS